MCREHKSSLEIASRIAEIATYVISLGMHGKIF